jgi:hypothetical protein
VAVAYVNAENVSPSFEEITQLMEAFKPIQALPNYLIEQSPTGTKKRVVFISQDGWQIGLLGNHFQIVKVPPNPLRDQLGDFSDFCRQASRIFQISLEHFRKRSHRLAALREGYLREMTESEMAEIVKRLMIVPNIYQKNPLKEWDWRVVTDIEREIEGERTRINTIAIVKKIVGTLAQQSGTTEVSTSINRIQVNLDINTMPTDQQEDRFGEKHVESFYTQVQDWHYELETEISRFISGD